MSVHLDMSLRSGPPVFALVAEMLMTDALSTPLTNAPTGD
jgi:hypothetical protein